ncbi:CLUMA_CG000479, isoform A [Clunio marinus]|uniref:CLUMA_CG000479, isoform A n=1 Tax=Clunio marinus TaxID=568069 RepID=A0A1J1HFL4_9DIPT|nr:CLUMA_CG000479, isoform A [Clunio marinus]
MHFDCNSSSSTSSCNYPSIFVQYVFGALEKVHVSSESSDISRVEGGREVEDLWELIFVSLAACLTDDALNVNLLSLQSDIEPRTS